MDQTSSIPTSCFIFLPTWFYGRMRKKSGSYISKYIMRVPDLTRQEHAAKILNDTDSSTNRTLNDSTSSSPRRRRPRCNDRPYDVVSISSGSSRSTAAPAKAQSLDERRSSCPRGKVFYKCSGGFTGCCSIDPCSSGTTCPDNQGSGNAHTKEPTPTAGQKTTAQLSNSSKTAISQRKSTMSTGSTPSLRTATTSSQTPVLTSKSNPNQIIQPPACPSGNGNIFKDASGIAYKIHCNVGHKHPPYKTVSVGTGGYGECFSACSVTSNCAGFTFIGGDSGICNLRSQMWRNLYVVKDSDYVSCAKVNPKASAPPPGSTTAPTIPVAGHKTSIGIIVGGVVGGVAVIGLLVLLIAFLAKRKKKKVEQRRATVLSHITQGPLETQELNPGGHQRQVSTSHDVFAPYGGFYRGYEDIAAQRDDPISSHRTGPKSSTTPTGVRAEGGPMILPAAVYRHREEEIPIMLDNSTHWHTSPSSVSRSPRFHEHLADLAAIGSPSSSAYSRGTFSTTGDSPTLGRIQPTPRSLLADDDKRKQQSGAWNRYVPQYTGGRSLEGSQSQTSPYSTTEPSVGRFDVLPLETVDRERWRKY